MNNYFRLIPIILIGSLLLAACASIVNNTPAPTGSVPPGSLPSSTETSQGQSEAEPAPQSSAVPSASAVPQQPTTPNQTVEDDEDYEIITLLPQDAIPAIFDPEFFTAEEADVEYAPDEQVMGVVFEGDARAYSIGFLSSHEIVNDTVGGRKIAVTW